MQMIHLLPLLYTFFPVKNKLSKILLQMSTINFFFAGETTAYEMGVLVADSSVTKPVYLKITSKTEQGIEARHRCMMKRPMALCIINPYVSKDGFLIINASNRSSVFPSGKSSRISRSVAATSLLIVVTWTLSVDHLLEVCITESINRSSLCNIAFNSCNMEFNSSSLDCTVSGSLKLGESITEAALMMAIMELLAKETTIESLFATSSATNGCIVGKV